MVRAGAIIQARLGSERLPNKVLLPLPFNGGPTMLEHIVARAAAATGLSKVVVATTDHPVDDAVQHLCITNQITCFRGSSENVLARFIDTAKAHELDVIIRLTGDNPFVSPEIIAHTLQQHVASAVDYTTTEGLPLGMNVEVVQLNALIKAAQGAKEPLDKEHVTSFIRRANDFEKQTVKFESSCKSLRLTVDYPSDYALASLIYAKLYKSDCLENFMLTDIEKLLQENQWLYEVNSHHTQRIAFASESQEFKEAEKILQLGGFSRVLKHVKDKGYD
ncbi:glycosyltransferase family protein [Pontibacter sp. E15-1]|uniref:cytidylyltransferase domain-containing protein n=1 Tax=Pontibacter sp. E15-1 TaxID=2919918 RepID=UPI001F4FD0FB|nr:glycosyltransferase family protein [Pontibacter sp. E15-1]MCJ8166372.1 glycosyltransferase family protein [Pontibacter sp. E15-1]